MKIYEKNSVQLRYIRGCVHFRVSRRGKWGVWVACYPVASLSDVYSDCLDQREDSPYLVKEEAR